MGRGRKGIVTQSEKRKNKELKNLEISLYVMVIFQEKKFILNFQIQ